MILLKAQGKLIDTAAIMKLFTQGEKYSDQIYITVPKINNNVDVSGCTFVMRTVAIDGSMTETVLEKQIVQDQVFLTWDVPETVTAIPGMLLLEMIGSKDAETIIKYVMPAIYIKEAVMGENVPVPDVIEEKLAQMNEILAQAEEKLEEAKNLAIGIDPTLTIAGQAADAKAAGDKIAEVESTASAKIDALKASVSEISGALSEGTIQEVVDARTSTLSGTEFSSLSQRLAVDFNTCVTQGELEQSNADLIVQIRNTGVGRRWYDENGTAKGEIFGDYENNVARASYSTAVGNKATASGSFALAMGRNATASGAVATAVGDNVHARGEASLAMGRLAIAQSQNSVAIGCGAVAKAESAIALGTSVTASGESSIVLGKLNTPDTENKYVLIVGNGVENANGEKNALTLDWSGNLYAAGDMTATNTDGEVVSLCELENNLGTLESDLAAQKSSLGMTKKNLLKNTVSTATKNGVTFTVNTDGTITCSGTATADIDLTVRNMALSANTKYILTGCPEGGSGDTYRMYAMNTTNWAIAGADYGKGYTLDTGEYTGWTFRIQIKSGCAADGLTFAPMLRYASIADDTYEQYTEDLQTQINALKAAIEALGGTVSTTAE